MRITILLLLLVLITGCATVNRERSTAICMEKGASSAECSMARMADVQDSNAKTTNAATGAVVGCILTGPFCLIPIGPAIGALIGAGTTN